LAGLLNTRRFESEKLLVVSHNLALSAVLNALTGEKISFGNLSGMNLKVTDSGVSFVSMVNTEGFNKL
jgi:phosphohistidine phosphatase SixA